MKRKALLLALLLLVPVLVRAQKSLELYYVAHYHYENQITDILNVVRQNARYSSFKTVVFYLSNIDKPQYVVISPKDDKEYQDFIAELNSQSTHNVYPEIDRMKLLQILSDKALTDGYELKDCEGLVFNFYINPTFAMMGYCDAVIGRLYWDLDLNSVSRDKLEVNIFHHSDDGYKYDVNQLFGRKNLLNGFPVLVDSF